MNFDITFINDPLIMGLLGAAFAVALFLVTVYRHKVVRVKRHTDIHAGDGIGDSAPGLSVIVYSRDSSDALAKLLPALLQQQYPGSFEVIVTTDGRSDRAEDIVGALSTQYGNLRMTYVPDQAHALSRKKLAVTLGIKAARYDYVLLTDANVEPSSPQWLATIGRHLGGSTEIVIGECHPVAGEGGKDNRGMTMFNCLADTVIYLSAAIAHHPYRASECNMAFRRDLFFKSKGFTDSVGLHNGIDDIFVSEIANGENTAVDLTDAAKVSYVCHDLKRHIRHDKIRHLFTGRFVSHRSRLFFGFSSMLMWLWLGLTVALGVLSFPEMIPVLASLLMGIVWMVTLAVAWRKVSRTLSMPVRGWLLPVYMFARPISNFAYRLRSRAFRSKNYTWAKGY